MSLIKIRSMIRDKHKVIVGTLLVTAFLFYTTYIYRHLPVPIEASIDTAAVKGKLIWQTNNCNSCHQIYGLGGYLGPDLTNVYSKRGSAYIQSFLNTGTVIMPQFYLSQQEAEALIAFLKEVDASGNADPKTFKITYDGFIQQH